MLQAQVQVIILHHVSFTKGACPPRTQVVAPVLRSVRRAPCSSALWPRDLRDLTRSHFFLHFDS